MQLTGIEVGEDLTASSRCDEGFLKLSRLRLRNRYDDGSESAVYPCDVVARPGSDAVVAVLFEQSSPGQIKILLREGVRPPIYLRKLKTFVHPDAREYRTIAEVVAGIVEDSDPPGTAGLQRRSANEALEEAGHEIEPAGFQEIGAASFASPGTSDEKIFYCAAPAPLSAGPTRAPEGDGSVMEEFGQLFELELRDAIARCRSGDIPDMKTELALLRLADHLGYIAQLDCFESELPQNLRQKYSRLGVPRGH